MRLLHATLARNLPSILRRGRLTAMSQGWAALHVVKRHGGRVEQVVVLEVSVPRSWLRRTGNPGLWYVSQDVPAARIRRAVTFAQPAA
jgi:hypothetical protein